MIASMHDTASVLAQRGRSPRRRAAHRHHRRGYRERADHHALRRSRDALLPKATTPAWPDSATRALVTSALWMTSLCPNPPWPALLTYPATTPPIPTATPSPSACSPTRASAWPNSLEPCRLALYPNPTNGLVTVRVPGQEAANLSARWHGPHTADQA